MTTYRRTAIAVGVLFIAAIVVLFIGEAIYKPILDEPDYLDTADPDRAAVIVGLLVEYAGAPAVVAISLLLYPVLRRHSEVMALGYVGFRVLEMGILISGIIAATVLLVGSILLEAFGESASGGVELAVAGPIAIVEVTLSGWLIAKGFNQSAIMAGQETGI